jgi:hypothetical protein
MKTAARFPFYPRAGHAQDKGVEPGGNAKKEK